MRKLYILGPPELRDKEGNIDQSFLTGSKRLGLLVYLVLARPHGFRRRDSLLPLFWPESDQKSARNALSNILYHMRQSLGSDIIINRGKEEIKLGKLWCDVNEFEEAVKMESYEEAYSMYRDKLLKGVHISGVSPDFEQWLDLEQNRLQRKYRQVLEAMAEKAEQRGDYSAAIELWEECKKKAPYESDVVRRLILALSKAGLKAEAKRVGRDFAEKLGKELEVDADQEFKKLTKDLDKADLVLKEKNRGQPEDDEVSLLDTQRILLANEKAKGKIRSALRYFREVWEQGSQNGSTVKLGDPMYDKALEEAFIARNNQPEIALTHFVEGISLYHLGRYSEALFALEEAVSLTSKKGMPSKMICWAFLAIGHSVSGNTKEAEKLLSRLLETTDSFSIGLAYAALDQPGKALEKFESVGRWSGFPAFCMRYLFPDLLKPIRNNKKYEEILKRVKNAQDVV